MNTGPCSSGHYCAVRQSLILPLLLTAIALTAVHAKKSLSGKDAVGP